MAALLLLARGAPAQTVEVRVRDDSTGRAVPGAIVRLVGPDGRVARQGLTSEAGRLVLTAPGPGSWRLRVAAIGFRRTELDGIALEAGATVRRELTVARDVVRLPTLVATASSRCETTLEEGTLAAALWNDVQSALTVVNLTTGTETLRMTSWERTLGPGGEIEAEGDTRTRLTRGNPYVSLAPEALAAGGFVQRLDDTVTYFGPDAALLLSDAFVRTHCFRAEVPGRRDDPLLGLAFEPVKGRRVPEIEGVLWVDAMSRELRHIEYRYVGLSGGARQARPGGRTAFSRLPDGRWIVTDWWIRTPMIQQVSRPGSSGRREVVEQLRGYHEVGGRVERLADPPPAPVAAVLVGSFWDSTTSTPLAGAMVRVAGETETALSDDRGQVRLEVSVTGRRVVTVAHPKLGLVADRSVQSVAFVAGQESRVELAVPALASFRGLFCNPGDQGQAGILGIAYLDGQPTADLGVRVTWLARVGSGSLQYRTASGRSGARGLFTFCRLPTGRTLRVELVRATTILTHVEVELQAGEVRWVDLVP